MALKKPYPKLTFTSHMSQVSNHVRILHYQNMRPCSSPYRNQVILFKPKWKTGQTQTRTNQTYRPGTHTRQTDRPNRKTKQTYIWTYQAHRQDQTDRPNKQAMEEDQTGRPNKHAMQTDQTRQTRPGRQTKETGHAGRPDRQTRPDRHDNNSVWFQMDILLRLAP